jgi:NADH-quinone oxidoreductase subunit L
VIIGMHHDQDIRNMGGLRRYMPITWITSLIGSLALIGTPFFAGFYSKESIIEAVRHANVPGAGFAYFSVVIGVFITTFYSFRMYFLVFHGKERWGRSHHGHDAKGHDEDHAAAAAHDEHHHGLGADEKPHESPAVITVPLMLLAIPSVLIGLFAVKTMLTGDFFNGVIAVSEAHPAMEELAKEFHGWFAMGMHAFLTLPFWLDVAGVAFAYYCYLVNPGVPEAIRSRFAGVYRLLVNKYYLDDLNQVVFAGGARAIGKGLWKAGDQTLIDGVVINGGARLVGFIASVVRLVQSGFIYHYAIAMIAGVAILLWWFVPLAQR